MHPPINSFLTIINPDHYLGLAIQPLLQGGQCLVELCQLLVELEYLGQGLVSVLQHRHPVLQHLDLAVHALLHLQREEDLQGKDSWSSGRRSSLSSSSSSTSTLFIILFLIIVIIVNLLCNHTSNKVVCFIF